MIDLKLSFHHSKDPDKTLQITFALHSSNIGGKIGNVFKILLEMTTVKPVVSPSLSAYNALFIGLCQELPCLRKLYCMENNR